LPHDERECYVWRDRKREGSSVPGNRKSEGNPKTIIATSEGLGKAREKEKFEILEHRTTPQRLKQQFLVTIGGPAGGPGEEKGDRPTSTGRKNKKNFLWGGSQRIRNQKEGGCASAPGMESVWKVKDRSFLRWLMETAALHGKNSKKEHQSTEEKKETEGEEPGGRCGRSTSRAWRKGRSATGGTSTRGLWSCTALTKGTSARKAAAYPLRNKKEDS